MSRTLPALPVRTLVLALLLAVATGPVVALGTLDAGSCCCSGKNRCPEPDPGREVPSCCNGPELPAESPIATTSSSPELPVPSDDLFGGATLARPSHEASREVANSSHASPRPPLFTLHRALLI